MIEEIEEEITLLANDTFASQQERENARARILTHREIISHLNRLLDDSQWECDSGQWDDEYKL